MSELIFDTNAQELFQIIGELFVEKRKAVEIVMQRDMTIAELQSKLVQEGHNGDDGV